MRVFVVGGTGVLGWRAVRDLLKAGHDVTAAARTPAKAARLRSLGATPVALDVFDPAAVKEAVSGHDVVVNLATHIPPTWKMAMRGAWAENDRVRRGVSRNLVDAALATGVARYIQESIAFMYAESGDAWVGEDAVPDPVPYVESALDAEASARRFTEHGGVGVVLRFGGFYCEDSQQTERFVQAAQNHIAPALGDPDGYFPMIHVDDAASAVVAALTAPAGTYNVVDDALSRRDQMDALAAAVGVGRLTMPPAAATKVGGKTVSMLARSQRVSNRRFKEATGWELIYPTVREGWPAVVRAMGVAQARKVGMFARIGLLVLAVGAIEIGIWATAAPQSFFNSYPGGGRHWVAVDGPFNEHLVRDFGAMNLALAVVLLVAIVVGSRLLVTTAAVAYLAFAVPHALYHFFNLQVLDPADQVANVVTLSITILLPIAVIWSARRVQRTTPA
ncbi:MAG: NAD(P)-dependent oxidoreductase, partial [Acidimicrobiia bacterium]|nr:NAD(P)-dependent oxidoreductase [Acidimicrobiia bacterium]